MENQSIQNPVPEPVQPVSQTPIKSNNFLVILLSILLLLSVSIAGFFAYQTQKLAKQLVQYQSAIPSPSPTATADETASQAPTGDLANWKTYNNSYYSFRIDYPIRFEITEKTKREDYYDTLATLTSQFKESITLRVIHDIDIYKNNKPEIVAEREIMDSGFKYNITTTKIGDYFAAITMLDNNPDKKSPTITIAHPNKNLFIVIDINADLSRVEFDQILSTFKFSN